MSKPADRQVASPEGRAIKGHLLMMLATVLVATSFPVGKAITDGLDSVVLTLVRFALAAVLFLPIIAWRDGLNRPSLGDLVRYGTISFFQVGFFWGMYEALRHTSTLNTATIFTLLPAMTAVVATVILRDRPHRATRIALPLGMLGAVWVIFRGDPTALARFELGRGDLIFLAATASLSVYGPLVKLFHRGEPMLRMTFWTLATGSLWLLLLALPRLGTVAWQAVPVAVYWGILYLAVFTTMATFFIVQWSNTVIGPTKTVSYTYLNPVLVLLIGLILGDPAPPWATYPGFLFILGAIVVLQRSRTTPNQVARTTST